MEYHACRRSFCLQWKVLAAFYTHLLLESPEVCLGHQSVNSIGAKSVSVCFVDLYLCMMARLRDSLIPSHLMSEGAPIVSTRGILQKTQTCSPQKHRLLFVSILKLQAYQSFLLLTRCILSFIFPSFPPRRVFLQLSLIHENKVKEQAHWFLSKFLKSCSLNCYVLFRIHAW